MQVTVAAPVPSSFKCFLVAKLAGVPDPAVSSSARDCGASVQSGTDVVRGSSATCRYAGGCNHTHCTTGTDRRTARRNHRFVASTAAAVASKGRAFPFSLDERDLESDSWLEWEDAALGPAADEAASAVSRQACWRGCALVAQLLGCSSALGLVGQRSGCASQGGVHTG